MSDRPPNSEESGGWRQPETPGSWRKPEQAESEPIGWRVPALPKDLEEEPQEAGRWHLPRADDTTFGPDDETEILRPEDALLQSIGTAVMASDRAAEAEAEPEAPAKEEAPVAPEDLMYLIEHIDEVEDEESGVMSELVALASLAQDEANADIEKGAESPELPESFTNLLNADRVPAPGEDVTLDLSKLSLAERAMMQPTEEATVADMGETTVDPAEYARRALEQFGTEGDSGAGAPAASAPPTTDTERMDATGEMDPAEYARQQLAQLGGDGGAAAAAPAPSAPSSAGSQLTSRQQELARQFHQTEEKVRNLRQMAQSGQMTQDEFMNELRNLMILDENQVWWMMGVETDTWYKAENNTWVPATPDVLLLEQQAQQPTSFDVNQSVQASGGMSLPYLDPTNQEQAEYTPDSGEIRLDKDYMPLPREVPERDPEATVANPAVFDRSTLYDPSTAPTVPGSAYTDQTVMSTPVEYGTVESPFDATEPPEYDDVDEGADVYERAAERRRQQTRRTMILVAAVSIALIFLIAAGVVVGALLWYNGIVSDWEPGIAALADYQPEFQSVTLLDSEGNRIGLLGRGGDDRRVVDLEDISPYLLHAIISTENASFYDDPGWNFFSILRAFTQNTFSGEIQSGASTITQQVARNFVLQTAEVSAERKVNEIVVAGEISQQYTKNEILELYLNEISFGNQTFGVEAAAQFYFDKSAAELNLVESALLAGIIQSPSENNPVVNRNLAFARMSEVMDRMAEVGCIDFQHNVQPQRLCITEAEVDEDSEDLAVPLALVKTRLYLPRQFGVEYPHFVQLAQAQLENYFGAADLYSAGYTVTTTIDPELQEFAQAQLTQRVQELSINGVNNGAIMVTDPNTCAVLAMTGTPDFTNEEIDGQVNNALTYQQPGSAIKPIVYAAALTGVDRNGNGAIDPGEYYTPATILWDVQTSYQLGPNDVYTPVNFDRRYHGPSALRYALQNSYNVPAVKTYEFIGTQGFINMANAMGLTFTADAQFTLATGVGATDVRLYDMMAAYGTIANDGLRCNLIADNDTSSRLTTIMRVQDRNGNDVPLPFRSEPVRAMSAGAAYLLQNILSDNQARAEQFGLTSPLTITDLPNQGQGFVGTKSGTSSDNRDLWTIGFTNNVVVGVWLGNKDNNPIISQPGQTITGTSAAGPVWNSVMRFALQGTSPQPFGAPTDGTVVQNVICADTGTLVGENCINRRNEIYLASLPVPPAGQGFVTTLNVDSWTGLIANDNCPNNIVTVTYATISDPSAVAWLNNTAQGRDYAQRIGLPLPVVGAPTQGCDLSTPVPTVNLSSPSGGQTVQGVIEIRGQISAEGFARYQIEVAPVGTENFAVVAGPFTQQAPAAGSVLGTWDTSAFPVGDYVVRLAVFATAERGGGYIYRLAQPVTVNNPLPTSTPAPTLTQPPPVIPVTPLPFDDTPAGPTPTIDPLGG